MRTWYLRLSSDIHMGVQAWTYAHNTLTQIMCGFNVKCTPPHWLICLNTCFLIGGPIWKGYGTFSVELCWRKYVTGGPWVFIAWTFFLFTSASCVWVQCDQVTSCSSQHASLAWLMSVPLLRLSFWDYKSKQDLCPLVGVFCHSNRKEANTYG